MNVLELVATLSLDRKEYDSGLDNAEGRAGKLGSKLAGGAKLAAKGFAVAGAAAATGVAAITKSAIEGYADLEQLKGGVETLFGDSAKKVIADANEAFKTAGMSANEYMETSIQSAAALINSLGGDQAKASELMNMSITDMADNVNKMGTSMESIQDAYRGFSRGNFTMLDNLALGFSGTKQGMQELLDKAEEISGVKYDISSYSDIVQAIHVVQTEMGITGTTAKEASETISGSIASLKTAWQNLVTGFADENADLDQLINNVVEAAETAFGNVLPVAEKAMEGVATFVTKAAPIIAEKLPEMINQLLPKLLESAMQLVVALSSSIPTMVAEIAKGISQSLPTLIPQVVNTILLVADALIDNIEILVDAALQLMIGLAEGLIDAIPVVVDKVPQIIQSVVSTLIKASPKIAKAGFKLFSMLVKNLPSIIASIIKVIPRIISAIVKGIGKGASSMAKAGVNLMKGLARGIINGIKHAVSAAKSAASSVLSAIKRFFGIASPSKLMAEYGRYIDEGLAKGILDNAGVAERAMASLGEIAMDDFGGDAGFTDYQEEITMPVQGSNFGSNGDLTVILELDRMQLGKAVYRLNNEETQRVGVKLSGGYA